MIDIHCHILPGIDDGPSDIEESIEMARIAANDGIKKIVASPHIKDTLHPVNKIKESAGKLNNRLSELKIPVEILIGADVSLVIKPSHINGYTINNTRYLLIEFPHSHLPKNAKGILFNLKIANYIPIITHPERNPSVIANPGLLIELKEYNTLVQITAGSLTGDFGTDKKECAIYLLNMGLVDFIATDAHSPHYRRPVLSEGLSVAEKIIGRNNALILVTSNPETIISGRSLN